MKPNKKTGCAASTYLTDFSEEQIRSLLVAERQMRCADKNLADALGLIFAAIEVEEDGKKVTCAPRAHLRQAVVHLRRYIAEIDPSRVPEIK